MTPHELFSLLSDETRLRCLVLLQKNGELCVCEMSHIIDSLQPKVSRHLALMRNSGLISDERRGQWIYYSLHRSLPNWAKKILKSVIDNLMDEEPYHTDMKKMSSLKKGNICKS